MPNKINKGEWAELFVFLKALSDGKIHAADEDLNKVEQLFYLILSAIKTEEGIRKEYLLDRADKTIVLHQEGQKNIVVPVSDFEYFSKIVLDAIKSSNGTFEIPEVEPFLEKLTIKKVKANSDSKKDIVFKIHDNFTGTEPEIGFSIKSYIGSKPTLLNASGATRLQYTLSSSVSIDQMNSINQISTRTKIKDRIALLKENDVVLTFDKVLNPTFERNLQMIDYRMPEILSYLYLLSYVVKGKALPEVVDFYCKEYQEDSELIEHKVKDLLVAIALGMEPNTKWTGLEDANGGYLVVKEDGEVLCYHIYDRNKLREYLYNHTKFDSPSTSRTGAGLIFEENEQQKFILTVQIRF